MLPPEPNSMPPFHPEVGKAARGASIPPVGYLKWYIECLEEQRPHNLSFSGLQFDWDLSEVEGAWLDHRRFGRDERDAVAQRYGVDVERVHLCLGATQGLTLALLAVCERGRIAVEMPSYGPVSQSARLLGMETVAVHRRPAATHWLIDREEWLTQLADVDAVVVTPQLNPNGWDYSESDRKWLVDTCREKGVHIISDEVYAEANSNWKGMYNEGEHCITVSSLTKVHGLGPIRYGWIIAAPHLIERIGDAFHNLAGQMCSSSVQFAEAVFPRLHEAEDKIREYREINLPLLVAALERLGIAWIPPPSGVFGAFRVQGVDTKTLIDGLGKENGFLAVPGCMFDEGLDEWLRVAWSIEPQSFAAAVEVLEKIIGIAMSEP